MLYPDDEHNDRAVSLLSDAAADGKLVVNPVVYSELAGDDTFDDRDNLDYFLSDTGLVVESLPRDVAFRAGNAFETHLARRGETLQCPTCGSEPEVQCPECDTRLAPRQHIAADFLIGAHAEATGRLLTFDGGFYRDYFDIEVRTVAE